MIQLIVEAFEEKIFEVSFSSIFGRPLCNSKTDKENKKGIYMLEDRGHHNSLSVL